MQEVLNPNKLQQNIKCQLNQISYYRIGGFESNTYSNKQRKTYKSWNHLHPNLEEWLHSRWKSQTLHVLQIEKFYAQKKGNIMNMRTFFGNKQRRHQRKTNKEPTSVPTNMNFMLNTMSKTTINGKVDPRELGNTGTQN